MSIVLFYIFLFSGDDSIQGIRMVPEEAEQEESQAPVIHQIEMSKAEVNFEDEEGPYFAKVRIFFNLFFNFSTKNSRCPTSCR